jgi:hypothetical protein
MASLRLHPEVEVLEAYYTADSQQRHLAHKQACHDNFALALMAHRLARGVEECLDPTKVDELLQRWAAEERTDFMVWSGFWLPVLERYRRLIDARLYVDCCRIDAEVSASFRVHQDLATDATEVWLWSWAEKKTRFEIPVTDRPPMAFAERDHRLVVHGGGWGLGSYRSKLAELERTSWACDVVVHEPAETAPSRQNDRYFMVDPGWRPWRRSSDREHTFPPFGEVGSTCAGGEGHALFELIRRSKAIVSKPGGGTLIDSLSSATPVVILEPYGYAEASNAALWEHLGFGISYSRWRDTGWDEAVLGTLQQNLLGRARNGPDYPRDYVERIQRRRSA